MKQSKSKLMRASIIIIALGLFTLSWTWLYYVIPGVAPTICEYIDGQPAPTNCVDDDVSGGFFMVVGVPVLLVGVTCMLIATVREERKARKQV